MSNTRSPEKVYRVQCANKIYLFKLYVFKNSKVTYRIRVVNKNHNLKTGN